MTESDIFKAAVTLPADKQRAYLDQACGSDAQLRHGVESLLRAHGASWGFLLEHSSSNDKTDDLQPIPEREGTVIGSYRIMEQIGEGGMGLVFVADQQQPVRRRVALKIIKPGMDTRDVIARFEAERQALALMDHPNIARVFDAGTTDSGHPYFVMELVKGIPIVAYCDQQQLSARERLDLFLSVCQAVQHAHGKGIIHRDLKPSNILVAPHDGVPVVKVIDFGVAKAIGQQLTDKTIYTRFAQMIGTPLYMSPEQAEINALDVDIRSDVYSLGVLLYELLTGTTPFDKQRFATAAYDEIRRIIKEEEPPKPSTRLSTLAASLPDVSASRKFEPGKLSAFVAGDLDWIVMKALEKDRSRRYETASAFAADVRRFLTEEPIEARPPSAWYRFRKMARRNRVALLTAGLVAAALVLGMMASVWQAVRATRAERIALTAANRAAQAEQAARSSEVEAKAQKAAADDAKKRAQERSGELSAVNEKLRRMNYIADVNLARHAWDENNVGLTRELLERHVPKPGETDLRGFEWQYLLRQTHRDMFTLKGNNSMGGKVSWSPDGKRLIYYGRFSRNPGDPRAYRLAGEIRLWDVATRQPLPLVLEGGAGNVTSVAISPDGKRLAGGDYKGKVRVWTMETGALIQTLVGHTVDYVGDVVWSPDGDHLASRARRVGSLGETEELRIWDLKTGKAPVSIGKVAFGANLTFSPDGTRLASNGGSTTLKIWDAASGRELLVKEMEAPVSALAFSPDGRTLAVHCRSRAVSILDSATGALVRACAGDSNGVFKLAFRPDGKQLAAAASKESVTLWDAETGKRVRGFKGHDFGAFDIAYDPTGAFIASVGMDGLVKVWDTGPDRDVISISGTPPTNGLGTTVVLSPHGIFALTGDNGGLVRLWNVANGALQMKPVKQAQKFLNWDFSADATRMVLTEPDKTVTVWDTASGALLNSFKHDGPANTVWTGLSGDGTCYASVDPRAGLKVWDVGTGLLSRTISELKDAKSFSFTPDGKRVAAIIPANGTVRMLDFNTRQQLWSVDIGTSIPYLYGFSPDGKRLAVRNGAFPGDVRILDAETGQDVSPRLRGYYLTCLRFSPDGKRIATGSSDGTIKIWETSSSQETLTLKAHSGMVTDVEFSADGHRLISTSNDMTVRIWDATPIAE